MDGATADMPLCAEVRADTGVMNETSNDILLAASVGHWTIDVGERSSGKFAWFAGKY